MKQTEILTRVTHVNGWFPAVYMSYTSQNFRLFHVSNLSVRNFRIFLLMYPGSSIAGDGAVSATGPALPAVSTGPGRRESGVTALQGPGDQQWGLRVQPTGPAGTSGPGAVVGPAGSRYDLARSLTAIDIVHLYISADTGDRYCGRHGI